MTIERWNEIFELLSMVILVDGRVYKEEVDTFTDSVMTLKAAVGDETLITRDLAFEWFRGHRDEILGWYKSQSLHVKALKIIMNLTDFEHRKTLLEAMVAVSVADKDFHHDEESLVAIAAVHWNIPLKDIVPAFSST